MNFQVHPDDNVATVVEDGGEIPLGHKIAVRAIAAGSSVIKFGVTIGVASKDIAAGEWVHLHNCRSQHDSTRLGRVPSA